MTIQRFHRGSCLPILAVLLVGYSSIAHAQRTASSTFHSFLDEVGIMVDGAFVPGFELTDAQLATNPSLFENHSEGIMSQF